MGSRLSLWRRLLDIEAATLLAVLASAFLLFAFVEIAGEVAEGDTDAIDRALLMALRARGDPHDPLGPPWLDAAMHDLTSLGSASVLTLVVVLAAGYLVLARRWRAAIVIALAAASGSVLSATLKSTFERARPDFIAYTTPVDAWSFPSGHAMLSAVTYLTVGAVLAEAAARRRLKGFIIAAAVTIALFVGASRVWLGVHYPSDVLAGWCVGAAWALLWREALRHWDRSTE